MASKDTSAEVKLIIDTVDDNVTLLVSDASNLDTQFDLSNFDTCKENKSAYRIFQWVLI